MTLFVALLSVRNEEWIIEKTLSTLEALCDHIFIVDQASTDGTAEICRRSPKTHYRRNAVPEIPEVGRQRLLAEARTLGPENVIFALDADEILSAQALDPEFRTACLALPPGGSLSLPWIWLWKSTRQYPCDRSVWANRWLPAIYRDDGRAGYQGYLHEGRIPVPAVHPPRTYEPAKILHFTFAAWQRTLAKEAHYRIRALAELPGRTPTWINGMHVNSKDRAAGKLCDAPDQWFARWRAFGVDLDDIQDESFSWYDAEILRQLADQDPRAFADLDIWDIDWEAKRRIALQRGVSGIPSTPIQDVRSPEQRLHHWYLSATGTRPFWREPTVLLEPIRRGLKSRGITRARLRQQVAQPKRFMGTTQKRTKLHDGTGDST